MMKTVRLIAAGVLAGTCVFAQSQTAVTKAASDASSIHASVAALDGVSISAFAAEVIDAIATKPKNPVSKVLSLIEASERLLAESDESNLADVIVAMISNVPFEALPEWTTLMFDAVQEATHDLVDASYDKLVFDVVGKIGDLADYTDEDKVVVTTFAIKLLSRGIADPEDEFIAKAINVVPVGLRGQVSSALPAVLGGDYSGILAGVDIIDVPDSGTAGGTAGVATDGGVTDDGTPDEGVEKLDGAETVLPKDPVPETPPAENPPVRGDDGTETPPAERPPVPTPYKGQ